MLPTASTRQAKSSSNDVLHIAVIFLTVYGVVGKASLAKFFQFGFQTEEQLLLLPPLPWVGVRKAEETLPRLFQNSRLIESQGLRN